MQKHLQMKLKAPFTTSFGTFTNKDFLLLEARDESGTIGWGESVAFHSPWYNEETLKTNWHMLEDYLIPLILNLEKKRVSKKFGAPSFLFETTYYRLLIRY